MGAGGGLGDSGGGDGGNKPIAAAAESADADPHAPPVAGDPCRQDLRYLDEKTCHNPRNDFLSASGSMVTDVLTQLTVIIIGSAELLAQGRRDG